MNQLRNQFKIKHISDRVKFKKGKCQREHVVGSGESSVDMMQSNDIYIYKDIFRKLVNIKQDDMKKVFHFNAKENTMIKKIHI